MPKKVDLVHDTPPPPSWPQGIAYLNKSRLSPAFPSSLVPFLFDPPLSNLTIAKLTPRPTVHSTHVQIKVIADKGHPAYGQNGLYAKRKIAGGEMIIPYLGIIHSSLIPVNEPTPGPTDGHAHSDYDLSLQRISASHPLNPFPNHHISIGIDAAMAGNAARFINDYRGIGPAPNAEFRLGKGEAGEIRMEVWSLKCGLTKGEEVLVSYGKGWWGARRQIND